MYIGIKVLLLNFLALKLFLLFISCACMCGYVCTCGGQRTTFHQVDPGAGGLTQVVGFGGKRLYLLSHFTGHIVLF